MSNTNSNYVLGQKGKCRENSLDDFYQITPELVMHLAADGSLLHINIAGLRLIEADCAEQVVDFNIYSLIAEESLITLRTLSNEVFTGQQGKLECKITGLKGTERWLSLLASPLTDESGVVTALLGVASDITPLKRAENSLLESQQRFTMLCETIHEQVWTAAPDGSLTYVNKRICDYFDVSHDIVLGNDWQGVIYPEDLAETKEKWSKAIKTGQPYETDFRLKRADGNYRWHISKAFPHFDYNGHIIEWIGTNTDITDQKEIEDALHESESQLADAQAHAKLGSWRYNLCTKNIEWSDELYRLLGLKKQTVPPEFAEVLKTIHPADQTLFKQKYKEALANGTEYSIDVRLPQPDQTTCWIETRCKSVRDETGKVITLHGTVQDITTRKHAEHADQELITASKLLDESQKIAKVGGWELDVQTGHLFWTAETYRVHDTSPEEFCPSVDAGVDYFLPESRKIITEALESAINEGKDYDLELETLTTMGRKIDVRTTCSVTMQDGKVVKLTGIFQDISEQKSVQRELELANQELEGANSVLEHIAHYDALTHLPNRTLLADRMQQAMLYNLRRGQSIAVAFLDLDGFKEVNDTYGHSIGDELLISIANRMKDALREGDTLARLGGDEFVAVITDLANPSDCEPLIKRMLNAASQPVILRNKQVQVSASIGVTIYPQDDGDAEQLLRHADQAMYIAKQVGKNCFHLFDVAKDVAVKTHREELENIRSALDKNEFVLHYQPKVNMQTGDVIGVEALIRWQHPERGLLAPAAFLPVVEEHFLSAGIGEWVISTALNQIESWLHVGLDISISVNIGAFQLQQTNFSERLEHILKQFPDVKPQYLELEILETSAFGDITQVSRVMDRCKDLGVSFALDDFGTGYSSLTYLKKLPAQLLKIDQSFVRDMLDDPDDLAIIQGIIGLAEAFRREVIAEGVETIAHGEKLLSLGCTLAQGYGIARPMPANAIQNWIKTWRPDSAWTKKQIDYGKSDDC